MKLDYETYIQDVKRLKLILNGKNIDNTKEDPMQILKKIENEYGKRISRYIGYYCCQSSYAHSFIKVLERLPKGQKLLSDDGHFVTFSSSMNTIEVNKNFRLVYYDDEKCVSFEMDNVRMSLTLNINCGYETCKWNCTMSNTYL